MAPTRAHRKSQPFFSFLTEEAFRIGATAFVVAFAVVTVQTVITRASEDDANLLSVNIIPKTNEDGSRLTIPNGAEQRFTAMGVWQTPDREETFDAPVAASWRLIDDGGSIDGCEGQKRCTFTAGETPGTYRLEVGINPTRGGTYSTVVWFDIIGEEAASPFFDAVPSWVLPAATRLNELGIMRGYDSRAGENKPRFGASDSVTRAQVTTLIARLLRHLNLVSDAEQCDPNFEDVPAGHFGCDSVTLFANQQWISAADRRFRPDDPAPREVTAAIIANAIGETIEQGDRFRRNDLPRVFDDVPESHAFFAHIALMNRAGFMTGQAARAGERPDFGLGSLNRAEIAVLMARILDWFEGKNIRQLQGYDPNARLDVAVPEQQHGASGQPRSACNILYENLGYTPDGTVPEFGEGYARRYLREAYADVTALRNACIEGIFENLMERYCVEHAGERMEWGVLMFDENGATTLGGSLRPHGNNWHICPEPKESAAPARPRAACNILRETLGYTPDGTVPEFGEGYARRYLQEVYTDVTALRNACTEDIFEDLMERYCDGHAGERVEWGVLMFDENGATTLGGGLRRDGNNMHYCPEPETTEPEGSVACDGGGWRMPWDDECRIANGSGSCRNRSCVIDTCLPGFRDANGRVNDGCEEEFGLPGETRCSDHWFDLANDPANCGSCNTACRSSEMCSTGACIQTVLTVCAVEAEHDSAPPRTNPTLVGNGYAKRHFTNRGTQCTVETMNNIMRDYCAFGTNRTRDAFWRQTIFDNSGPGSATTGVGSWIERHSCP